MTPEELAKEATEAVQKSVQGLKTELTPQIDTLVQKNAELTAQNKELDAAVRDLGAKFEASKAQKTPENPFLTALTQKAAEVYGSRSMGHIPVGVTLKAAATDMTRPLSNTGEVIAPRIEPGITDYAKFDFSLFDSANRIENPSDTVRWVEKMPRDGAATPVVEANGKPKISFKFVARSAAMEKIAAHIKVSREMLKYIPRLMTEINTELTYAVDEVVNDQLYNGNGTAPQIQGILEGAQPLDLAGIAGSIVAPTMWDVVRAAITQIAFYKWRCNEVRVNITDYFIMTGSKDKDENYIIPPFVSSDGRTISNVRLVIDNTITEGTFLAADMTKFYVETSGGMDVIMGYQETDLTDNLVTIVGERFLLSYIKTNHAEAFVSDTFANGIAFLTPAP